MGMVSSCFYSLCDYINKLKYVRITLDNVSIVVYSVYILKGRSREAYDDTRRNCHRFSSNSTGTL